MALWQVAVAVAVDMVKVVLVEEPPEEPADPVFVEYTGGNNAIRTNKK